MFLSNLKFLGKIKLKLLSKVAPIKQPVVLLLDKIEIEKEKINQKSLVEDFTESLLYLLTSTSLLQEQIGAPVIKFFHVLFDTPRIEGKSYQDSLKRDNRTEEEEHIRSSLPGKRAKEDVSFNIFDLLFPNLLPPLGDILDLTMEFPSELYHFQRPGVKFLVEHQQALLGDEMGLGKSIQTIVALRCLFRMAKINNGLIVCPKSVLTDWDKKLFMWAPELRILRICGSKEQRYISWNTPAHIYLTTYESLRQDIERPFVRTFKKTKSIVDRSFDVIILDEIQKIKNPTAGITLAIRPINASYRWGLSGTPLENRLEDLISIFGYLKPGLLRKTDSSSPLKVKETIKPYFLRRRKVDVLNDLPPKNCNEIWLELLPDQRKAYDRAEKEGIVALDKHGDSIRIHHILALIEKLKQLCNIEPVRKQSCKLEYLLERLEEIVEEDAKALVFSQYPGKTIKLIEPELKRFNPLVYHGMLSDTQRDKIVDDFQNKEDCKVLLISVRAGGLGLTLTRANFVFHFDLWWNPAIAAQTEDRTHRIGQKKPVYVTSLFTVNTIEERIQNLLQRKRELFSAVIDDLSDRNLSKALSMEELFSLFGLKPKA